MSETDLQLAYQKVRGPASKRRRDPFKLSSNETEAMAMETGIDCPHPKDVPGSVYKKARAHFSSAVYLIDAELYYNHLIDKGHGKKLEEHGIINHETLVSQFGAW